MKMYCHNYSCEEDTLDVVMFASGLYTIDDCIVASSRPICPRCADCLSTETLAVPEAFSKVKYPFVQGKGSSRSG